MTYREDSAHNPDPHRALVGGTAHPGDALMVQPTGEVHPTSIMIPAGPTAPQQDVLKGGMDANTFMHALRRQWLLALCTGIVMAIATGTALWFTFPESSSATALFEVSNEQTSLLQSNRQTVQEYEILKKSQLALLKSNFVLTAASRPVGVASLSVLAGESDPIDWLQENLMVDFPQNGEILSISISDDAIPEDLVRLVDAVAKAYKDEVVNQQRQKRLASRDLLARNLEQRTKEIKRKMEEYLDIAKETGKSSASDRDAETELMLRDLSELSRKREELTTKIFDTRTDFMIMKGEVDDPGLVEAKVDELLEKDLTYQYMKQSKAMLDVQQMQDTGSKRGSRTSAQTARQSAQMDQQMMAYREDMKKKVIHEQQTQPNYALQTLTKRYNYWFSSLNQQLNTVNKSLEGKMAELKLRNERVPDLETREADLKQLQEIVNDMSVKLESLDIDASAPDQIKQVQQAVETKNIDKLQHYAIAGTGALAGFALSCLAIGYLEFSRRRLNGPHEVDEGLGIRVVGTLPSLSSRKALDPNHPVVAQLTESIDNVRTILMHDSTSKRRQVVLVTSPATGEGRTTVASQLAASLARAGRRTLLIDGDLRRPALHALFDVPLEDGLCEVLRAEVDVADVIRPTHAEGLWLLTAGYCDIDAIHALATEQMQPVFEKLRAEYDFIIIDGAPVLGMSDALIFGQYSDGAILSVRRDESQMPKIHQAAELLRGVGIRIIGAVVNGVQAKADDRIVQMRLMAPKAERELQPTN
jgi:capsular exopolysaccharide synthesis family protein